MDDETDKAMWAFDDKTDKAMWAYVNRCVEGWKAEPEAFDLMMRTLFPNDSSKHGKTNGKKPSVSNMNRFRECPIEELQELLLYISPKEYFSLSPNHRKLADRFDQLLWSNPRGNVHAFFKLQHLMRKNIVSWEFLTKYVPDLELDPEASLIQLHRRWISQLKEKSDSNVENQLKTFYRFIYKHYRDIDYPKSRDPSYRSSEVYKAQQATPDAQSKEAGEKNLSFGDG